MASIYFDKWRFLFIRNQFYAGYNSCCTFKFSGNVHATQTKLIVWLIRIARRSTHVGYSMASLIFAVLSHFFYPRCYTQNLYIVSVFQSQARFAWSHWNTVINNYTFYNNLIYHKIYRQKFHASTALNKQILWHMSEQLDRGDTPLLATIFGWYFSDQL